MTAHKKYKRRFYAFITFEPPQRYFVTMQFIVLGSMMTLLLYTAYILFQKFSLTEAAYISPSELPGYVREVYRELFIQIVTIFLAGFVVNILFGLFFLHRITGPLVRVRQVLNKIADGEYPSGMVRFRRDDFLNEMAIALSRLLDFLNRMRVSMRHSKMEDESTKH